MTFQHPFDQQSQLSFLAKSPSRAPSHSAPASPDTSWWHYQTLSSHPKAISCHPWPKARLTPSSEGLHSQVEYTHKSVEQMWNSSLALHPSLKSMKRTPRHQSESEEKTKELLLAANPWRIEQSMRRIMRRRGILCLDSSPSIGWCCNSRRWRWNSFLAGSWSLIWRRQLFHRFVMRLIRWRSWQTGNESGLCTKNPFWYILVTEWFLSWQSLTWFLRPPILRSACKDKWRLSW